MLLKPENTKEFVESLLPAGGRIEQSKIIRDGVPIADIDVNCVGVFINSTWFRFGEIPVRRIVGLRRLLMQ